MNNYMTHNTTGSNKKLKVAVLKDALPFSTCGKDSHTTGVAVKIWEYTAAKHNIDYEYVCVERGYDKTLEDIHKGIYDVGLAEFSVIHRRYDLALYSRPYYISKMKVYRKKRGNAFYNFITNEFVWFLFLIALSIIFLYAYIRTVYLKSSFFESLYITYIYFFANIQEFLALTLRGNKTAIKTINSFWTIIRYIFFTIVVAQAINIIVQTTSDITDKEFKNIKKINVIKGTSYVDYVKNIGKVPVVNNTNDEIIKKLYESNYDEYWLDDANIIDNAINKSEYSLGLDSTINPVINDEFTIVTNNKLTDLMHKIDDSIIELQDKGDMIKICKGFMDDNYANCSI